MRKEGSLSISFFFFLFLFSGCFSLLNSIIVFFLSFFFNPLFVFFLSFFLFFFNSHLGYFLFLFLFSLFSISRFCRLVRSHWRKQKVGLHGRLSQVIICFYAAYNKKSAAVWRNLRCSKIKMVLLLFSSFEWCEIV